MRDRGFTLLELVVVLAMFSLVALIGVRVLQSALQTDQKLTQASELSAELTYGLALLRRDLDAAANLTFTPPRGRPEAALDVTDDGFALSLLGLSGGGLGVAGGEGRVVWRLDRARGELKRQLWPTLAPASSRSAGPEVVVLTGLQGLEVSVFIDGQGWLDGRSAERVGAIFPRAVRVRLRHDRVSGLETVAVLQ